VPLQVIPKHRAPILPRKTRTCPQKTLVLDLDETLVHSSLEVVPCPDFTFPVHFNNQVLTGL
jgi:CTD small phosphatase-like protein 2